MKIKILKNETLVGKVLRNENINYTVQLTTYFQEYYKTGRAKGQPKEITKKFFFKDFENVQKEVKELETKFSYETFSTHVNLIGEAVKINEDWESGLYFKIFNTKDLI
jgi:hypothetical protein